MLILFVFNSVRMLCSSNFSFERLSKSGLTCALFRIARVNLHHIHRRGLHRPAKCLEKVSFMSNSHYMLFSSSQLSGNRLTHSEYIHTANRTESTFIPCTSTKHCILSLRAFRRSYSDVSGKNLDSEIIDFYQVLFTIID